MAHDVTMEEALERFGADLSAWPDPELAGAARRLALSDRAFRARLEDAAALEAGLMSLRDELDADLAASGAIARVEAAALAALPHPRGNGRRWAMVAAAVLVAAALGALADLTLLAPVGDPSFEVVVLDPLFLDPPATLSHRTLSP